MTVAQHETLHETGVGHAPAACRIANGGKCF
jgi:hypothetical protein